MDLSEIEGSSESNNLWHLMLAAGKGLEKQNKYRSSQEAQKMVEVCDGALKEPHRLLHTP